MADAIRGTVVVNEIHPQPVAGTQGYDTDTNGTVSALDEYLEFYNTGTAPVDLSGLQLWDPGSGNWFTFPANSVLGPKAYAIVVIGVQPNGTLPAPGPGGLAFNAGRSTAVMNNAGDNIFVFDPAANNYITAGYGNWGLIDPTHPLATYGTVSGLNNFPAAATPVGNGEHFGVLIPGDAIQRIPSGTNIFVNNHGESPGDSNFCFTGGTLIATPDGQRPVETLTPGDRVLSVDGRVLVLRHALLRRISVAGQLLDERLRPVRIAAGALGQGLPHRDLLVSRQHRMLLRSSVAGRMFGQPEVLVAAIRLTMLPGIAVVRDLAPVSFVHLAFDRHEIILAEGAPSESLLLNPETLRSLPSEIVEEMALICSASPEAARFTPTGLQQRWGGCRSHPDGIAMCHTRGVEAQAEGEGIHGRS